MKIKISLPILTAVILSALKVSGVIAWSWIWVLFPLWVPVVLSVLITIVFYISVKGDSKKIEEATKNLQKIAKKRK